MFPLTSGPGMEMGAGAVDGSVAVTLLPNCPRTQTHPSCSKISPAFDI